MSLLFNVFLIYMFVFIGFLAKRIHPDTMHEQAFVKLYIYFLMPFVMIWGILSKPLSKDLFVIPMVFLLILLIGFAISLFISKFWLVDPKNQAIGAITGLIGNTGNMGIPIGLAVYGVESVPYTAMINLVNAIFVMTIGAYTYSRGTFSVKESILNVLKLPMVWATGLAFFIQWKHILISKDVFHFLEMGAYTGLVIQLIIFGMFLATVSWNTVYPKIAAIVLACKFIVLPMIALIFVRLFKINHFFSQLLFLQTLVPIAVNNVNLASLYDCYPDKVAWVSFISFIIAFGCLPIGLLLLR
jgi:predicted permease